MQKKVISEIGVYYGQVEMPKGFEIDRDTLQTEILKIKVKDTDILPFSIPWDLLNKYLREHLKVEYDLILINKAIRGYYFKPGETSRPFFTADPHNLRNAPDFVLLYGVHVKDCLIKIYYDDNRRKGKWWDIPLINNKFIMFPATQLYYITNNQKDSLNFIQTTTYEST